MKRKDSLYKYTKIVYIPSIIDNGIWASCVSAMNDPYEYIDIANPDEFHLCCFTRSANAKLMWSHYADSHRGCSIQIETPADYGDEDCVLKRVAYSTKYNRKLAYSTDETIDSLFKKDKKWEKEIEVRAVMNINSRNNILWNINSQNNTVYFPVKIKRIYFGCMVNTDSQEYYNAIQCIDEYNRSVKKGDVIDIKKYKCNDDTFRFDLDSRYVFSKELSRFMSLESRILNIKAVENTPYIGCSLKIEWIVSGFGENCNNGFIVQEVVYRNTTLGEKEDCNHYYEAWKVVDGKIEDSSDCYYDDELRVCHNLLPDKDLIYSLGKEGLVVFRPSVFWVDITDDLSQNIEKWSHEVKMAGNLRSVEFSEQWNERFSKFPKHYRRSFVHCWKLKSKTKIHDTLVDFCSQKWPYMLSDRETVDSFLSSIAYFKSREEERMQVLNSWLRRVKS